MEVDDSGRWNIVDNIYNGVTFHRKNNNKISIYIFLTIKALSGEYKLV